jgi:hypothetical protein
MLKYFAFQINLSSAAEHGNGLPVQIDDRGRVPRVNQPLNMSQQRIGRGKKWQGRVHPAMKNGCVLEF